MCVLICAAVVLYVEEAHSIAGRPAGWLYILEWGGLATSVRGRRQPPAPSKRTHLMFFLCAGFLLFGVHASFFFSSVFFYTCSLSLLGGALRCCCVFCSPSSSSTRGQFFSPCLSFSLCFSGGYVDVGEMTS